ncbi:hypothetical protein B5S31_g5632 [[Candida] boidinii]|nr:hypothetical protein B5S29_g5542 [[Candida] boidinii]OWB75690.1 hypothetical protein B5S31_g5632 [[Candida] boidinii]
MSLISSIFSNLIPSNSDLSFLDSKIEPILNIHKKNDLIEGIPDGILALILPVVVYWIYSTFFHIVDIYKLAEKYRIHPSEEVLNRNKVSLNIVIRDVISQHIIQSIAGFFFYKLEPTPMTGFEKNQMWNIKNSNTIINSILNLILLNNNYLIYIYYNFIISIFKILIGFLIIDTWQFNLHRLMHINKFLYKRFHSRHHRLYVPYAFGALFNDPVEGFLLDTVGAGLASLIGNLTPRENMILYCFSTMKTVDDHCGYSLPFDLFQIIFPNNSLYHDIHHQHFGIKSNFSQPFFTFWDNLFGTTYHGFDSYKEKQKQITLVKYKQFLKERKQIRVKSEIVNHEDIKEYSDSDDEPDNKKEN